MIPVDLLTIPAFRDRISRGAVARDEREAVEHARRCLAPFIGFLRHECDGEHTLAISTEAKVAFDLLPLGGVKDWLTVVAARPTNFERYEGRAITAATLWFDDPTDATLFTIRYR